jgi:DNA-binding transcriptional LysR family regulator
MISVTLRPHGRLAKRGCLWLAHPFLVTEPRHNKRRSSYKLNLEQRTYTPSMATPELRQMRYVVEVAQQRNFSRAAEQLHVAQQALSQQIKTVENQIGVQLFTRNNRGVELTPAGVVFVQEARRVLAAADRAVHRAQATAKGEAGSVKVAYSLTSVYETLPAIVERVEATHHDLKLQLREVFSGDVAELLSNGEYDIALCPRTAYPADYQRQELRREPFVAAVSASHHPTGRGRLKLSEFSDELFELWPREMAPGFYDAVLFACRDAGFEPKLDEHAAGSTVWRNIAQGRGVALVVGSLIDQLPRGITLLELTNPPILIIDLVWHGETASPAVKHVLNAAKAISSERLWLSPSTE